MEKYKKVVQMRDTLTPKLAANLADRIYTVQDQEEFEEFLTLSVFDQNNSKASLLKATVGTRLINTKDGFGACIVGSGDYCDDVFLIFRGSTTANYGADWLSNARIGLEISKVGSPVHIGFNHIFTSMVGEIDRFLSGLQCQPRVIHCIGHSLGGAVATLAADWAKNEVPSVVKLYTFGAPRPATHIFSYKTTKSLDKENIYRVYHESDPVPMIPVFPFCHVPFSNMAYLIHTKPMIWPWDHMMGKYIDSVNKKGRSWSSLVPTAVHEPTDEQIKIWLESNVSVHPSKTSTWQWIGSAIFYVLRKIVGFSLSRLQATFVGAITLADNIAIFLKQALDNTGGPSGPSGGVSILVRHLMRKIVQIIGMGADVNEHQLTHSFMRIVLNRLIERSHYEATKALRSI